MSFKGIGVMVKPLPSSQIPKYRPHRNAHLVSYLLLGEPIAMEFFRPLRPPCLPTHIPTLTVNKVKILQGRLILPQRGCNIRNPLASVLFAEGPIARVALTILKTTKRIPYNLPVGNFILHSRIIDETGINVNEINDDWQWVMWQGADGEFHRKNFGVRGKGEKRLLEMWVQGARG